MAGYQPLYIKAMETGLVQSRQNFILPNDAYPTLQNSYVWREKLKKKQGYQFLGRLQRNFTASSLGTSPASATWTFDLYTTVIPNITETNASIVLGSVIITDGTDTFTDQGNGILERQDGNLTSTINYITGEITLNRTIATANTFTITFSYYPGLPVMGIRNRENQSSLNDETIFWDQVYAYNFNSTIHSFEEFLPGTTWTGTDYEFFWTTNYWVGTGNFKIFWSTNFSGSGDPIRYCNGQTGTAWVNFTPQIAADGTLLLQALALLPFRGRLVSFNTIEGTALPGAQFSNRIRWSAIGNPFTVISPIVSLVNINAWRDDIRGQGGYLDMPTSEDITSVGFVRDNLVIYCERSTWQLRYTGRSIAPFQIEKVNSELGSSGAFSTIQFDTSLVGIGDKGIVECDSFKSERMDIKIPDFVFELQTNNNGPARVQGIRDFYLRLAYWIYPSSSANGIYPDSRLVYNYENDSWAIFSDSLTSIGTFQIPNSRTWLNTRKPWVECNFAWINQPANVPTIVGGNQQGFIEILDEQTINDPGLYITAIDAMSPLPTVFTSPNHNLQTGQIIQISRIPNGTPFDYLNAGINPSTGDPYNLNNGIFYVIVRDANDFTLNIYDPVEQEFDIPQVDMTTGYIGGGVMAVRDNFNIVSKKFNFADEGQSIQLGYLDILMDSTSNPNPGAISMNVYLDYNDDQASNTLPDNIITGGEFEGQPDGFFNQTIPTTEATYANNPGSKFWQRVYCSTRANFLTIEYTFSNAQMAGIESSLDVQIDAQVLWIRPCGRMTQQ